MGGVAAVAWAGDAILVGSLASFIKCLGVSCNSRNITVPCGLVRALGQLQRFCSLVQQSDHQWPTVVQTYRVPLDPISATYWSESGWPRPGGAKHNIGCASNCIHVFTAYLEVGISSTLVLRPIIIQVERGTT